MYDCEEMIGGKLHIVSKEQVRLKPAAADGNVDTVWADRKYFKCIERSSQVSDSEASVVETSDLGSFGPLSAFRFDKSPDVVDVGTPVLSNGYVMVSGTTLRALDLLTVKYLQILGFNPNVKNPTKKEIQDTTLPETADAEEEFHKAKEYLLKRQFQDEDGPILPSIIHDPQSFGQEDVIWNCIDHTDLKPNVLALQKECNKKKKRSDSFIRVLRIPNDPFFDESSSNDSSSEEDQAQDQDQTPSRRRIEMISPDPCGMFIEARKMTTRTDFSAAQKQGMFSRLSSLDLLDPHTHTHTITKIHNQNYETAAQRSFKISQFACVQHLCPCMSPRKNEPISAELEGLRPPKEESLSTLSYCYVTDAQSSLVSTDADGSVDETSVSSTPTGQDGCVGVLRETMTPELANAFFHQETGSMKWIRKCSHSAEDYQDEQFTGFFGFFKNIGRYVIRRWIFEDRHCVPV